MLKNFTAYELAKALYDECNQIKAKHCIKDQLDRASLSIVLNLAEGCGKTSNKDRRRFYEIALGSLRETQAILDLLKAERAIAQADKTGACLFKLVKSLH